MRAAFLIFSITLALTFGSESGQQNGDVAITSTKIHRTSIRTTESGDCAGRIENTSPTSNGLRASNMANDQVLAALAQAAFAGVLA